MAKEHRYRLEVAWTGNRGAGTSSYGAYGREHEIRAVGKPPLPGSSDLHQRLTAEVCNEELGFSGVADQHASVGQLAH